MSKFKKQDRLKKQSRDVGVDNDYIEKSELDENYTQVAWESKGAKQDVWVPNGASNFPELYYDFNGQTSGSWSDNYQSQAGYKSFVFFHHSANDLDTTKKYKVDVTCNHLKAFVDTDGGRTAEVFADHISGYINNGSAQIASLVQKPERGGEGEPPSKIDLDKWGEVTVEHSFPQMQCTANTGIAFVARGFEKDGHEISTDGYAPSFRDVVGLLKDARKAVTTGNCGPFIYDVISMISHALIDDPDDAFNPCVIMFSKGACQFIHEVCGGQIDINTGTSYGLESEDRWYGVGSGSTSSRVYIQIAREKTSRKIYANYTIKVAPY